MNISKMIEDCEVATPGPWKSSEHHTLVLSLKPEGTICAMQTSDGLMDGDMMEVNAAHIARFDPTTCKAILEFLQAWDQWWSEDVNSTEQARAEYYMLAARVRLNRLLKLKSIASEK